MFFLFMFFFPGLRGDFCISKHICHYYYFPAQHVVCPGDVHPLQGEGETQQLCGHVWRLSCFLCGEANSALCFLLQPTMLQWIELLTKQFNNSQAACEVSALLRFSCFSFFAPSVCTTDSPPPLSLPLTPSPTLSGSWTGWLTTTGGPCRSSSSVPIRSSDRSVRSLPEPVGRASPHWIKWHRIECLCLSHFGYICINTAA